MASISIGLWSMYHGQGVSTIMTAMAAMFGELTDKKILMLDLSDGKSFFDKYLERDIEIKNGIDDINVYRSAMNEEIIKNNSTKISDNVYAIKKSMNFIPDKDFVESIIKEAKKSFEVVLVKIGSGYTENTVRIIDFMDKLVYVTNSSPLLLNSIVEEDVVRKKLEQKNVITIVNRDFVELDLMKDYKFLKKIYSVTEDKDLFIGANYERRLFSYMIDAYDKKVKYSEQINKICSDILKDIGMDIIDTKNRRMARKWRIKIF